MLLHEFLVIGEGSHQDMVDADASGHTFESVAYETLFLVPYAQELFRAVLSAEGPEPGAYAAGEDNAISVVSHKSV